MVYTQRKSKIDEVSDTGLASGRQRVLTKSNINFQRVLDKLEPLVLVADLLEK